MSERPTDAQIRAFLLRLGDGLFLHDLWDEDSDMLHAVIRRFDEMVPPQIDVRACSGCGCDHKQQSVEHSFVCPTNGTKVYVTPDTRTHP